uniref:VTT domain-containing protein n=1 Tax=Strigamia maritima TaxID=126957 RepID=T1J384_STRMM
MVTRRAESSEYESDISSLKEKSEVTNISNANKPQSGSNKEGFIVIIGIFISALLILTFVYSRFPQFDEDEIAHIKLPRDIEDAKKLGNVLSRYKDKYYYEVLGGIFIVYILYPLCFLFSFYVALTLICLCSAIGASLCYSLSNLVGRNIVQKYFPQKAKDWAEQVNRHSDHLLYYIIFLRITPFLPNWFINITSPVIGVSLRPFFLGTFIGVAPPSFVAIQAGMTLQELSSSADALSLNSVVFLIVFSILALVPVVLKNRLREKMA